MKFDMSAAWNDATAMMSGNREVLLVVAGLFFLLPSVALSLSVGGLQEAMLADPESVEAMLFEIYAGWWWLFVVVMLAQFVGYLSLLALLRDSGRPTVGEAFKTGLIALLPAIAAYLLTILALALTIGVFIGIAIASGSAALSFIVGLLAFVAAVYIGVKLSLTGPVIAIDKVLNPVTALIRSWRLTKGNSFRLLLFYLLLAIVYIVISMILGAIIGALTFALGPSTALTVNGVVSGVLSAIVTVVFVAVIAAVHRQLSGPSAAAVSETFE